ncbi:MAG: 2-aminobenzoate-CoA ligase, partial [Candidatus Eremiobacteraeota bacterium]|nr:2-aminobenzoate-CoA ligase [Candidatus Eremiobacteraeota bacterium]
YVVLSETVADEDAKSLELIEFVKARIAPYKAPREIEFVAALPRTETGKVQRFRLREKAATEEGSTVH